MPYDEALDPGAVEHALDAHVPIELVSVVHCETPSGIENPLGEITAIAHERGALVLADVVSTLGGSTLLIDDWHIDLAVAGSQKCLGGPPGISLISVSDRAWRAIDANQRAPRRSYLSLLDWKHTRIDGGRATFPHAPAVHEIAGLHAALSEMHDDGGVDASIARHSHAARATRVGVKAAGLQLWPCNEQHAAHCLTAVRLPRESPSPNCSHTWRVLRRDALRRLRRVEGNVAFAMSGPPVFATRWWPRSLPPFGGVVGVGVSPTSGAGAPATMELLAEPPAGVLEGSTPVKLTPFGCTVPAAAGK